MLRHNVPGSARPGSEAQQSGGHPENAWRLLPPDHPRIFAVPAFQDNYIWVLLDPGQTLAAVIDPGDAAPVLAALGERGLKLATVLITHHHADHVGGLDALKSAYPDVTVYGPHPCRAPGITQRVESGETVVLEAFGATFEVLEIPGHTLDHVAYFSERIGDDPRPVVFCGDTLFAGGCGRVFEGTPAQMVDSLGRLNALPAETLVYCAHEYTLSNLAFAQAAEPGNQVLAERLTEARSLRAARVATVPSSLAIERETNPFLRCAEPAVRASAEAQSGLDCTNPIEVFAALREWKNRFRA